ncbi:MAG: DUF3291 domain-containing protein [Pseudomonadota bacterium]
MKQLAGHNLAQLNVARLVADPDSPRVAPFIRAIDRINGIGKRSDGFVWMMEGSGAPNTGATDIRVGCNQRDISNLTVWKDVQSLEDFVWQTVHRQFYERRAEWFKMLQKQHFVMWWIPKGSTPSLEEALARLDHLNTHGNTDHAFGWSHLEDAKLWRTNNCSPLAAE